MPTMVCCCKCRDGLGQRVMAVVAGAVLEEGSVERRLELQAADKTIGASQPTSGRQCGGGGSLPNKDLARQQRRRRGPSGVVRAPSWPRPLHVASPFALVPVPVNTPISPPATSTTSTTSPWHPQHHRRAAPRAARSPSSSASAQSGELSCTHTPRPMYTQH